LIFNPLLIKPQTGGFLVLSEAGLSHYPGLHWKMQKGSQKVLNSVFARLPLKSVREGTYALRPVERADYIAEISPGQSLPWRIFGYFQSEGDILKSDLVYNLSDAQKVPDISWITPGKATWDWWNNWSISGVDFKAGSNTATYKYYIDFAAQNGLQYFNIDDGWSDMDDLYKISPDVNLDEVLAYAKQKSVKILLWATWFGVKKDVSGILKHYASKGVAGFKIDFLNRDDQEVITWMEDVLIEGAKNKLLINFHGACKPTGWARTYPNEVNREGVFGAENFKWSTKITAEQECLLPFIRGFAGVLDYTPGGLRNISEKNFKPVFSMPFVKGTRCHQLALYGIFEAPLQMVSDLPQVYKQEPEAMEFISRVPTTWAESKVLAAELGKVVALARKSKTGKWYVFVLGGEDARKLTLDLSFTGGKTIKGMADGPNTDKNATDWKAVQLPVKTEIELGAGGGFVGEVMF
jgi:alpha-glucosidase